MATGIFNEMLNADGTVRAPYLQVQEWVKSLSRPQVERALKEAEGMFRRLGITFAVYGEEEASERLIPFDIIPRVFAASEWRRLTIGIEQRVRALNAFIHDIYHRQEILRAGRVPQDLILQNAAFVPEMVGLNPVRGVYAQIIGVDIVRVGVNDFYVLEDNCRTPSGVSYMVEDREAMMFLFPDLFKRHRVAPVENYPAMLRKTLESVAPPGSGNEPTVVLLTPGIHNSAFFEHAFLADEMGVELCEGSDLFVKDGWLYMRTTQEPRRVDVVYRRIDDAFLDPLTFRPDSTLGVPGLFDLYRAGRVTLVNAPGTGIADDKSVYSYLPEVIEFYTGERPLLKNVPTWRCGEPKALAYVLDHLSELVVKEVHGSGGYGMLVGPTSSRKTIEAFRRILKANPTNYIAQPTLALSTSPTFTASGVAPRHIDLRPFVLTGDTIRITPGGLTRVALKKGSLVVNSSQGGGTKDTWVLED
ncbi:MAG: circularly permuted type 2 ATP-grasp protein [Parvibaculaceae bacterium]